MKPQRSSLCAFKGSLAPPKFGELGRLLAVCADAGCKEQLPLPTLWQKLTSSELLITDAFFTDERCFLALEGNRAPSVQRILTPRNVGILRRVLLGEGYESVAFELGLASSTITLTASACLRAMGLHCRTSRVPVLLAMIAHASPGCSLLQCRVSEVTYDGTCYRIVSAERPDACLAHVLSPAECAVARLLVEGKSHAEIAILGQVSRRTVENQLGAAFQKLNVSRRLELCSRLIRAEAGPRQRDASSKARSRPVIENSASRSSAPPASGTRFNDGAARGETTNARARKR